MARISVNTRPVADSYADKQRERVIEFSADGKGGLISIREDDSGAVVVELYRLDSGVTVRAPIIAKMLSALKSQRLMLYAWQAQRESLGLPRSFPELDSAISETESAIAKAELKSAAPMERREPAAYRVRRCNGNRSAWCLVRLRADGSEVDSFGGYTTALSLDSLFANAGHLRPLPGDRVELIP